MNTNYNFQQPSRCLQRCLSVICLSTFPLVGLILALIGLSWPTSAQTNTLTNPTWSSSGPGAPTYALAIDPNNPNTVYAGGAGNVFKSNDGGATWYSLPLFGNATTALAIDRTNPQIVYAGIAFTGFCHHSFRRLFKSLNGGESWGDSSPPINGCDNINALVLHPSNSNILYVANFDDFGDSWSPLITSPDAGATWNALYGPPFAALAIDPHHANTIYAGTFDFTYFGYEGFDSRNGVLKSSDGGVSWNTTGLTNTAVEALVVDPVNPNTLYAVTRGFYSNPRGFRGLFKSTDGGASWSAINNGLVHLIGTDPGFGRPSTIARASLVVHPTITTTLYAGFPGSGVFKSVDGGANWSPFNDGLTNLDIRALALAPGNPSTLYAATAGGVSKIIDNTAVATNAIDDAQFFVRQQYADFLNRPADDLGLAFWTNQIAECGTNANCIEAKRVNVSAAFFLSIEFQETGYFVYRTYKAAYGDMLGTPVPLTRQEFLPDTQRVGQGVVVGASGWEQALENNKNTFAGEFVARSRFT
ncbi:MAG: hypothetical protein M3410_15585, partial [Acidobacteriota bacterium]|nr:hypothetical protein [Acidobacteriota bacterium]